MAKGRVADVMGKGGGLNNGGHVIGFDGRWKTAFFVQPITDHQAQRPPDAGYFKAMGQAGMNIVIFGQRVHLRLALQASECRGKNDPVIILVKIGPAKGADAGMVAAKAGWRQQLLPVHHQSGPIFEQILRCTVK